jgi:hypothetical protein
MARSVAFSALLLLCLGAFVAAQDISKLLTNGGGTCDSNPCFKEVNMPEVCCEADYLYTLSMGVGAALSALSNDTATICSDRCRSIVLGPFKKCLAKQLGNDTVSASLPDDFCEIDCLFEGQGYNIPERDIYDCSTLEEIPVDCRFNLTKNSKVGSLFTAAYKNCEFDEGEYIANAAGAVASYSMAAMMAAGAAALMAVLA